MTISIITQEQPTTSNESVNTVPYVLGDIALSMEDIIPVALGHGLMKILSDRAEFGKVKYGTYLTTNNGRNAKQDFQEEIYDALFYSKQMDLEKVVNKDTYLEIHQKLLELLILVGGNN